MRIEKLTRNIELTGTNNFPVNYLISYLKIIAKQYKIKHTNIL